jgi:peptide/nickel transport system substrate-binding protein
VGSATTHTHRGLRAGLLVTAALAVVLATTAGGAGARTDGAFALPRSQTLYVSGKQWGPYTDFNPFRSGDYATGVVGLVYETMFRYDPLKDRFIPWLATNGRWAGNTYVVTLRRGVKWSDGRAFTARDVKFSFETGKLTGSDFATLWRTGLAAVTTSGNYTVRFRFRGTPNYQQWDWYRYNIPIAPQHIWKGYSATQITTGNNDNMARLIGTGPFVYGGGKGSSQTLQWNRRNGWWATKALGKRMWMRYIVDIHNTSNTASLQNFIQGKIDLSNNFFPGVDKLIRGPIQTYYTRAPYMLAANTAWLVPNLTKAPLNDRAFRKALAASIDIGRIVRDDYGNIVSRANPTGLLPIWNKWIDQAQVRRLGFKHNVAAAKALLAANGYRDRNNDGYVENKDGSALNLRLIVPNGWSDWQTAIQMIADSTKDAGIRVTPAYPDFNALVEERNSGKFDLVINNEVQLGNSPYSYYEYLFRLPIADTQTTRNFQRYQNQRAWNLTVQLNRTKSTDTAKAKAIHKQLQQIMLTDLPVIPLWYNGMWAQYNTRYWTNFARANGSGLQNTPSSWNGYINMTGIDALAKLRPR